MSNFTERSFVTGSLQIYSSTSGVQYVSLFLCYLYFHFTLWMEVKTGCRRSFWSRMCYYMEERSDGREYWRKTRATSSCAIVQTRHRRTEPPSWRWRPSKQAVATETLTCALIYRSATFRPAVTENSSTPEKNWAEVWQRYKKVGFAWWSQGERSTSHPAISPVGNIWSHSRAAGATQKPGNIQQGERWKFRG